MMPFLFFIKTLTRSFSLNCAGGLFEPLLERKPDCFDASFIIFTAH